MYVLASVYSTQLDYTYCVCVFNTHAIVVLGNTSYIEKGDLYIIVNLAIIYS